LPLPENGSPAAAGVALEYRRAQSERLGSDPANPKLHALNVNLDVTEATVCRAVGSAAIG